MGHNGSRLTTKPLESYSDSCFFVFSSFAGIEYPNLANKKGEDGRR